MKLTISVCNDDFYNNDLDVHCFRGTPQRLRRNLKKVARKARRNDSKKVIRIEICNVG